MPTAKPPQPFPPIPEFYGATPGPQVAPPVNNAMDWAAVQRQTVPPPQSPLLSALMEMLRRLNMGVATRQ